MSMDRDEAERTAQRLREWREGIEATLSRADAAVAEAERRQAAREEAGLSPWRTSEPLDPGQRIQRAPDAPASDPVPPLRRSASTPRDWVAEQKWVTQICDQRIAAFSRGLEDAMGMALAEVCKIEERERWGPQIAELRREVAALRAELNREDGMGHGVQRLESLVSRLEEVDPRMRRVTEPDDDVIDLPVMN